MAVCWWFILFLLFTGSSAQNDFFTSIGQMTDLLFIEKDLVTSLKDYIRAEESKLETIKNWADRLDVLSAAATEDPEGFLGHPVNAFKLMKRLNTEWGMLESLVRSHPSDAFLSNVSAQRQHFPSDEDQVGAARALMRLLHTYELDTNTIATGALPGSSSAASHRSSLTVDDCFELGKVAYSVGDYYQTELWMSQALRQLDEGETPGTVDAVTILYYLSYAMLYQEDLQRALGFTQRLLQLDPTHEGATVNLKYFEYHLNKQEEESEEQQQQQQQQQQRSKTRGRPADNTPVMKQYNQLCRGEAIGMTPLRQSRLFCRYYDNNRHPMFVFSPAQQEDEWDVPRIVRYHNIVTDAEMEQIKELAKPRLCRAGVSNRQTGEMEMTDHRISKSAWLRAFENPVVERINQRIEDLTGLDLTTAEDMQVANYGVGGQYEPHLDFAEKQDHNVFEKWGIGNRIATWLLYMSDVQAGGATVFTNIGAAVWPKKGTAVFWYNLYSSGEGDYRTEHAACPVLVGSKWVCNKWIHERGQEFRRRCSLNQTD